MHKGINVLVSKIFFYDLFEKFGFLLTSSMNKWPGRSTAKQVAVNYMVFFSYKFKFFCKVVICLVAFNDMNFFRTTFVLEGLAAGLGAGALAEVTRRGLGMSGQKAGNQTSLQFIIWVHVQLQS